jgi:uncharacterized DUF497 family protein
VGIGALEFVFDWDPDKAKSNLAKHGVSFEDAMNVFQDPNALTIFDEDGSAAEDRWITLGEARSQALARGSHPC